MFRKIEPSRQDMPINQTEIDNAALSLTYLFENMPEKSAYAPYKSILRKACRYAMIGRVEEGGDLFKVLLKQRLSSEYKEMIEANLKDIKSYLKEKNMLSKYVEV